MYVNKAIIIGNLVRDPEQKSLPSGIAVTNFSVATNRVYKDRDGNRQESTDYHNVVVFGRQAETAAQYLKKGQSVFIEGRIQTRSWEQDGQKKYRQRLWQKECNLEQSLVVWPVHRNQHRLPLYKRLLLTMVIRLNIQRTKSIQRIFHFSP